jgi:hypothetical protein
MIPVLAAFALTAICGSSAAAAQPAPRQQAMASEEANLLRFANSIQEAFRSDPKRFSELHPGTPLIGISERGKMKRIAGDSHIIRLDRSGNGAVILLTGTVETENSGDATIYSSMYSGPYLLEKEVAGWRVKERISPGTNRIVSHKISADLNPSIGMAVHDELAISVVGQNGFFSALNADAKLKSLTLDGKKARHVFQNGLLWVEARPGNHHL